MFWRRSTVWKCWNRPPKRLSIAARSVRCNRLANRSRRIWTRHFSDVEADWLDDFPAGFGPLRAVRRRLAARLSKAPRRCANDDALVVVRTLGGAGRVGARDARDEGWRN